MGGGKQKAILVTSFDENKVGAIAAYRWSLPVCTKLILSGCAFHKAQHDVQCSETESARPQDGQSTSMHAAARWLLHRHDRT
jgi:hypothetical protein